MAMITIRKIESYSDRPISYGRLKECKATRYNGRRMGISCLINAPESLLSGKMVGY